MASFNGNIGTPANYFNLQVDYSSTQNIAGNYSDVTATAYVKRNNTSAYPYNSRSAGELIINGTAVTYTGAYDLRTDGYKQIISNTVRVPHNNDGTKSITISFSFDGKLSSYYPNGIISQSITLPTIPRQPSYNSTSAGSITETSVKLTASIDSHGLTITSGGWDVGTSTSNYTYYSGGWNSKTISGLQPNTTYYYRCYAVNSAGGSNSSWKTFTTYAYPYLTSVPNHIIGNDLTIQWYNPLNRSCKLTAIFNGTSYVVSTSQTGTSSSPYSNETWQKRWYSSLGTSATSKTYQMKLEYGGNTSTKSATYSINANACKPQFSVNTEDINPDTLALTNDATKIINGYSIVKLTPSLIRASNVNDETATISNYSYNGRTYSLDNRIYILNATTNTFNVIGTNSRNVSNTVASTGATMHPYFKPIIANTLFKRPVATSDEMDLSFDGTSFNKYFDSEAPNVNNLTIKWYVKKNEEDDYTEGGTLVNGTDYTINTEDNTFQSDYNLQIENPFSGETGWDYMQKYYFKLEVSDVLSSVTYEQYVTIGIPVYDWYTDSDGNNHFEVNGYLISRHLYTTGGYTILPSGDALSSIYWCSLKNGWYFHTANDGVSNMPENYCFIRKQGSYRTDGGYGDVNVIVYTQPDGKIYRASSNQNSSTMHGWYKMLYESDIFYKSGDRISIGGTSPQSGLNILGMISTGSTTLYVTIPVPKRLDNINTITCTKCNVESRGTLGYLNSAGGYKDYATTSSYTLSCSKGSNNTINLLIQGPTFTNVTNNTPIVLHGIFEFSLT